MERKTALTAQRELNVYRGIAYALSAPPVLELTSDLPDANGVATAITGGGYAAAPLPYSIWFPAADGKIANAGRIEYPVATAAYRPQGWQIKSGGDILYAGHLREGMTIDVGSKFFFDTVDKNFVLDLANSLLPQCCSKQLLNRRLNVLRGQTITPQATLTIRLGKTVPNSIDGSMIEISAAGYVPAEFACSSGNWTDPALTRIIENAVEIPFQQFQADTGEIRGYQIESEGELWYWGELGPGKYGWNRDILSILPGGLRISA